jgi:hypothetical protein
MTNCVIAGVRGNHVGSECSIRARGGTTLTRKNFAGYAYYTGGSWTIAPTSMELVNCTIADGKTYGAVAVGGAEMSLQNCIVYGNSVSGVVDAASVTYSCIQEAHDGVGNFVADPHWTGAPYYHLLTKRAGGAITDGWFGGTFNSSKTEKDSPCIDAGEPGFPGFEFEPKPNGRRINLGAYGGTPWASRILGVPGTTVFVK